MPGLRCVREVRGRRIAVIGALPCSVGEALFLRHYTEDVTLVTLGARFRSAARSGRAAFAGGIAVETRPVRRLSAGRAAGVSCCIWAGSRGWPSTWAYSGLGVERRWRWPSSWAWLGRGNGRIETDGGQRTSVPMVWAAGDVVTGLNQIAVAMGQAEIAATGFPYRDAAAGGADAAVAFRKGHGFAAPGLNIVQDGCAEGTVRPVMAVMTT